MSRWCSASRLARSMPEGDPLVVTLPVAVGTPGQARMAVGRFLTGAPPPRVVDVLLLVSELVTDAVRRAGASPTDELRIDVWPGPTTIRVAVTDPGPTGGEEADEDPDGWKGRLLARISDRWGVDGDGTATSAWFEVDLTEGRLPSIEDHPDAALFAMIHTNRAARDVLFARYTRMASGFARRFTGRGEDIQDLEQVASIGLLKALERFDVGRGASFSTFASATILGELKRHLRDKAWSVRVPRGLKETSLELSRVTAELTQSLGRAPRVSDLVTATGRGEEEILEALQAGEAFASVSINTPAGEDDTLEMLDRMGGDDPAMGLAVRWEPIAAVIGDLPERERRILYLRFYKEMTQSEIAAVIGISQMHVSRLLARALASLRLLAEA